MALSRIWSAFIIIAIGVACIKCFVFPENNRAIFANMVSGKAGDTVKIKTTDSAQLSPAILQSLNSKKIDTTAGISTVKYGSGKYLSYKMQNGDGVSKPVRPQ